MKRLHLSPDFSVPATAVTETFAILAVRGAGKTNAARVMAEEMFAAGAPFVAIDPVGSWWGLRAGRDGKTGGIPIPVFGGKHGDVPLERSGGELVADLVVEQRLSCVLDLSEFESEAAKRQFLLAFAQRLYRKNTEPLHLFLEECDDYVPQRPGHDQLALLGAFENIVRRGRSRGLGLTLITQRSAVVNKNVLTQVGTLVTLRTTSPQDRAAVEAWVEHHGQKDEILASLPALKNGEAWVWSPHFLEETRQIRFRQSTTHDSGATPTLSRGGAKAVATLADVDLGDLQKRMAATIERAKLDDPKALRAKIASLEKQLAAKPAAQIERVDVPALQDGQLERAEKLADRMEEAGSRLSMQAAELRHAIARAGGDRDAWRRARGVLAPRSAPAPRERAMNMAESLPAQGSATASKLGRCERAILTVLAQHASASLAKIALLAGYRSNGGGFRNALGALRSAGLIHGGNGLDLMLTDAGVAATEDVELLPVGPALIEHWKGQFGLCERKVIEALAARPSGLSLQELADAAGYAASGGGFRNALGALRTAGVLVGGNGGAMRLADELLGAA